MDNSVEGVWCRDRGNKSRWCCSISFQFICQWLVKRVHSQDSIYSLPGGGVGFDAGIVEFGSDAVVYHHDQLLG